MDYYNHPAMSRSKLVDLDKMTPYEWYLKHLANALESKSTKALDFGSAFHCAILEPHLYNDLYCYNPYDMRTKQGKEFYGENNHKTILSKADNDLLDNMFWSLSNHPAYKIIKSCDLKEEEFYFDLEGIEFKAKIDCVDTKSHIIYDVKTSADSYKYDIYTNQVEDKFFRDMSKYGNDAQVYIYSEAYKQKYGVMPRFTFICIQKKLPYQVQVIDVEESFLECGMNKTNRLISLYKDLLDIYGDKPWESNGRLYAEAPIYAQEDIILEIDGEEIAI